MQDADRKRLARVRREALIRFAQRKGIEVPEELTTSEQVVDYLSRNDGLRDELAAVARCVPALEVFHLGESLRSSVKDMIEAHRDQVSEQIRQVEAQLRAELDGQVAGAGVAGNGRPTRGPEELLLMINREALVRFAREKGVEVPDELGTSAQVVASLSRDPAVRDGLAAASRPATALELAHLEKAELARLDGRFRKKIEQLRGDVDTKIDAMKAVVDASMKGVDGTMKGVDRATQSIDYLKYTISALAALITAAAGAFGLYQWLSIDRAKSEFAGLSAAQKKITLAHRSFLAGRVKEDCQSSLEVFSTTLPDPRLLERIRRNQATIDATLGTTDGNVEDSDTAMLVCLKKVNDGLLMFDDGDLDSLVRAAWAWRLLEDPLPSEQLKLLDGSNQNFIKYDLNSYVKNVEAVIKLGLFKMGGGTDRQLLEDAKRLIDQSIAADRNNTNSRPFSNKSVIEQYEFDLWRGTLANPETVEARRKIVERHARARKVAFDDLDKARDRARTPRALSIISNNKADWPLEESKFLADLAQAVGPRSDERREALKSARSMLDDARQFIQAASRFSDPDPVTFITSAEIECQDLRLVRIGHDDTFPPEAKAKYHQVLGLLAAAVKMGFDYKTAGYGDVDALLAAEPQWAVLEPLAEGADAKESFRKDLARVTELEAPGKAAR